MDNQYPGKHVREMYSPVSCTKSGVCRGHVYLLFLFLINIFCMYSVEPPRRYGAKVYPKSTFLAKLKMSKIFHEMEKILYTCTCILHGQVFVIITFDRRYLILYSSNDLIGCLLLLHACQDKHGPPQ